MTTVTYANTREFAQKCLEGGYSLNYKGWYFYATSWDCGGGCCSDAGLSIDEVMSALDGFSGGDYGRVIVRSKT